MSQPYNREAEVPALRPLNKQAGEFWVPNPWLFSQSGENLSYYERNMAYLNAGDGHFHDIAFLTGADSDGDGRSVVACDITGDGMPELFVRQAGGGPLLVFENRFPKTNWLSVSLRGSKSNRFGIGAKVICEAGGKRLHRELYPIINFLAQAPAVAHFGLSDAAKIDRLTIRWPSGSVQEFTDLTVNQHLLIREDSSTPTPITPGESNLQVAGKP